MWILFVSFLNFVVNSRILVFEVQDQDNENSFHVIITEPFTILELIGFFQISKQLIWEILWNSGVLIVLIVYGNHVQLK